MRKINVFAMVVLMWFVASPVFAAITPNDSFFNEQWYLSKIQAPTAWETTKGSSEVIVAVLDTGFDLNHPDLTANKWVNKREVEGNNIDDDENGYIDDMQGWNFVEDNNIPEPPITTTYDQGAVSHGTVIAGIIGAMTNNQKGVAGINWNVKLMSVRILDNMGAGNSGSAREGIRYAVKNGAKVINLSFTGYTSDLELSSVISEANAAGVLIVAAVGNTEDGGINVDNTPIYPACDGHGSPDNGIIGVASTDKTDTKSSFSNYGATCTDIAAPGEDILSTVYHNAVWTPFSKGYYQDFWSGTSMAAPMVSGAAALIFAEHSKNMTPAQIKNVLRLSADPVHVTGVASGKMGAGRLNVARAIELAQTLYPPEAKPGSLIKTHCSPLAEVNDPCKAVYFYASDGKRHAFPNDKVYFTWYADFSTVKEVSSDFLSSLALGKNVTYHPGTKLVKFQTVPTVFAVEAKGVLRAIGSEAIAAALHGADWNKKVDDISDVFFGNYTFGSVIDVVADYNIAVAINSVSGLDENF